MCGVLDPGDCRAKTAAPQGLISKLAVNLQELLSAWTKGLDRLVKEKKGKVVYSESEIAAYEEELWKGLEKEMLDGLDKALHYGLDDAAEQLGIEIEFSSVDKELIKVLQKQEINLSQKIASKCGGNVKSALIESQRQGENLFQTVERLKSISTLSTYEAERIARTELSDAANAARLQGYKGRWDKVEWVLGPAYNGHCQCPDYVGVYTVEKAMTLPISRVHPNCDCYWKPYIEPKNENQEETSA